MLALYLPAPSQSQSLVRKRYLFSFRMRVRTAYLSAEQRCCRRLGRRVAIELDPRKIEGLSPLRAVLAYYGLVCFIPASTCALPLYKDQREAICLPRSSHIAPHTAEMSST